MTIHRVPDEELIEATEAWAGNNVLVSHTEGVDLWCVEVGAMEGLRGGLEDDVRHTVAAALSAVPGVTQVRVEDRERWEVSGKASGEEMAGAVEAALEPFAGALAERMSHSEQQSTSPIGPYTASVREGELECDDTPEGDEGWAP